MFFPVFIRAFFQALSTPDSKALLSCFFLCLSEFINIPDVWRKRKKHCITIFKHLYVYHLSIRCPSIAEESSILVSFFNIKLKDNDPLRTHNKFFKMVLSPQSPRSLIEFRCINPDKSYLFTLAIEKDAYRVAIVYLDNPCTYSLWTLCLCLVSAIKTNKEYTYEGCECRDYFYNSFIHHKLSILIEYIGIARREQCLTSGFNRNHLESLLE